MTTVMNPDGTQALIAHIARAIADVENDPGSKVTSLAYGPVTLRLDIRRHRKIILDKKFFATIDGGDEVEVGRLAWGAATFVAGVLAGRLSFTSPKLTQRGKTARKAK